MISIPLVSCCAAFVLILCHNHQAQSAEIDYVIDTLVVVDDVMYRSWRNRLYPSITKSEDIAEKVKQYVYLIMHQANKRLATTTVHANFSIRLQVVAMDIDQPVLEFVPDRLLSRKMDAETALSTFKDWLVRENKASSYDHAMLLTGRPMESTYEGHHHHSGGNVAGRAYVGAICDQTGMSVSVIQDPGGFQSVYFVAHEVAHSLGAVHDGESGALTCSADLRYLMAAVNQQVIPDGTNNDIIDHPWYLSSCSVKTIDGLITNLEASGRNCLTTSSPPMAEFLSTESLEAGQVYDVIEQCRMIYGSSSNLCLGKDFASIDQVCTAMFCSRTSSSCVQHYAADGTSCGNKTWCQQGRCVASDVAPQMDENCPYGDTALLLGNDLTCEEFIARSPSACYNAETRQTCCSSCAKIHTGVEVCPYGDTKSGCTPDLCQQIYPDGTALEEECCGTCKLTTPRKCEDVPSIDGFTCQERSRAYGKQECYNTTVAYHCCQTCSELRINVSDCFYGDLITGGYCQSEVRLDSSGCTDRLATLCCLTCDRSVRQIDDGDPNSGVSVHPGLVLVFLISLLQQPQLLKMLIDISATFVSYNS